MNHWFKTFRIKSCMIKLCGTGQVKNTEGDGMVRISKRGTGKNIRKLLAECGITVREVQEELELDSPQSVYKWLNGKALPSLENLLILGSMLNISMEQILVVEGTEEKEFLEKRKQWSKNHPPVLRAYRFTVYRRLQDMELLAIDSGTDWKRQKGQNNPTEDETPVPPEIHEDETPPEDLSDEIHLRSSS